MFRLATGVLQAVIYFGIAWFFYGLGQKHGNSQKEQTTVRVAFSGLVVWAASSSLFKWLIHSIGYAYVVVITTLALVVMMSYLYGRIDRAVIKPSSFNSA